MKAAFLNNHSETIERVFGAGRRKRLEKLAEFLSGVVRANEFDARHAHLQEVDAVFSS